MRSILLAVMIFAATGCSTSTSPPAASVRLNFTIKHGNPPGDSLYPVYPNPFNRVSGDTALVLQFALADSGTADLLIQNALGGQVAAFSDTMLPPGFYRGSWNPFASDGTPLRNGIYFVTLRHGNYIDSRLVNIEENE